MSQYFVPPDLNEIIKDMQHRLKSLANAQGIPTYTVATRPTGQTTPFVIFVSDATAGQRFQAWDVTAAAWVPLG